MSDTSLCRRRGLFVLLAALVSLFILYRLYDSGSSSESAAAATRRHFAYKSPIHLTNLTNATSSSLKDFLKANVLATTSTLPNWAESVDCPAIFEGDSNAIEAGSEWTFDAEEYWELTAFDEHGSTCDSIRETFAFSNRPLSSEEEQFPIAYSMLTYKDAVQVYFMLSAVYHPQNAYCIAFDGKSSKEFKYRMELLAECFPNVFVMGIGDAEWASYEIVRGVFGCVRYLTELNHPWKYYQYLSGFDLPLKTNREMVRIFKRLNGTVNTEVVAQPASTKSPLTIWKSSMSGVFSRATANFMVHSPVVHDFIVSLKDVGTPDEKLWATIAGNPSELKTPGGFDAKLLWKKVEEDRQLLAKSNSSNATLSSFHPSPEEPFHVQQYWIGRYQVWPGEASTCHGKYASGSCVFGTGDLPDMFTRGELSSLKESCS